jgi:hypothetical protein
LLLGPQTHSAILPRTVFFAELSLTVGSERLTLSC